jgi:Zn-dependent M28 family amino/carboxypeptidase
LRPGLDFIIAPESRGLKGSGALIQQDSTHFIDPQNKIMVSLEPKLTWSVSTFAEAYTSIILNKKTFKEKPTSITINIENKVLSNFKAANVCGLVKGTTHPDSLLVITAHYDHLGGMGQATYFPGANDDASGVMLLLSLAKYYSLHPLPYSVAFICFGGEEAGLIGSKYFSENPLLPLTNIRFLLNLDLVGTGEEGITVVNGSVFKKEFGLLNAINDREKYLVKIKSRGKAANSDHYWFSEKGVPSFFIYAMGGIQAYHDVFDRGATLPLTEFEDLFRLIVTFNDQLIHKK